MLDCHDLQALRQHCIKNWQDSVVEITACMGSGTFPTTSLTLHPLIHVLYHVKKKKT